MGFINSSFTHILGKVNVQNAILCLSLKTRFQLSTSVEHLQVEEWVRKYNLEARYYEHFKNSLNYSLAVVVKEGDLVI